MKIATIWPAMPERTHEHQRAQADARDKRRLMSARKGSAAGDFPPSFLGEAPSAPGRTISRLPRVNCARWRRG